MASLSKDIHTAYGMVLKSQIAISAGQATANRMMSHAIQVRSISRISAPMTTGVTLARPTAAVSYQLVADCLYGRRSRAFGLGPIVPHGAAMTLRLAERLAHPFDRRMRPRPRPSLQLLGNSRVFHVHHGESHAPKGLAGPCASLTHDYDDPQRHKLFGLMRRFFMMLSIPADSFDDCVAQAQWNAADVTDSRPEKPTSRRSMAE
jgi:hypothetical protein